MTVDKAVTISFEKWGITTTINHLDGAIEIKAISDGKTKFDDLFTVTKINKFGQEVGDPVTHNFGDSNIFAHKFSIEPYDRIGIMIAQPIDERPLQKNPFMYIKQKNGVDCRGLHPRYYKLMQLFTVSPD